jgi:hypothetical protein
MPISKTFTIAGTALLVFLLSCQAYVYDAYFHEGVRPAAPVHRMADDITPAARIRETFALFVPVDARLMRDTARLLARAVKPQA